MKECLHVAGVREYYMTYDKNYFIERHGCPFCQKSSNHILSRINYHDTAEVNRELPNILGKLYHCLECGVAYPSHVYNLDVFPKFYQKSFKDLNYLDDSFIQVLRKKYIKEILRNYHKNFSLSRFLDAISLHVFQVPNVGRKPINLKILDVGCGFGEFLSTYKKLGNDVFGTEIIPKLVARLTDRGYNCHCGELEDINFNGIKFDVIILRAVFYRTRNPRTTLFTLKNLLASSGEIAMVDPCPGKDGADYFFKKQFPQGQFYIVDKTRYMKMLYEKFNLRLCDSKLIYGRPKAPLKSIKLLGNVIGLLELLAANMFKYKPYTLSYNLKVSKKT